MERVYKWHKSVVRKARARSFVFGVCGACSGFRVSGFRVQGLGWLCLRFRV